MSKEEQKIKQVKKKLVSLGLMLPGRVNRQFNICGKPNCQCKASKNPSKHGPYYQLSFTVAGKSSSFFLKKEDLFEARQRIGCYQKFRKLSLQLIQLYVDLTRKQGLKRSAK